VGGFLAAVSAYVDNNCADQSELFISVAKPKGGRILRIFRCQCEKLTSIDDRA